MNIDLNQFIKDHITYRQESFFSSDIEKNANTLHHKINNKRVLVIGGAGTIGSSYIRAILKFNPSSLYVVDTNENGLTELTRDLRSRANQFVPKDYKPYPINFGSEVFYKMLEREGPFDIIANFAAHKHVRSEKDKYSVEAMIENNVFKANDFLHYLNNNHKPEHFFCVSTDKAANPVNVMGASKKLMEDVIMSYSDQLQISTARFANVAFSNGSLLDGYIQRLMKKQPFSCPSDVKRFFVSPEESGQICMLACMLGDSSDIFFPKLKEDQMVNFKNITLDFLQSMGLEADLCSSEGEAKKKALSLKSNSKIYPVYFFDTDTSGEKLFEEFYTTTDQLEMKKYSSLGVIKNANKESIKMIESRIGKLKELLKSDEYEKSDIVNMLTQYIPDFEHIETGKSLDQKM
jgi:FlaA1/EpsC-like NDP-sugar epimerase